MNQSQFRGLLILYAIGSLVLWAYAGYFGLESAASALISGEELQPEAATVWEGISAFLIGLAVIILVVVAWLGLFMFWKPARIVYVVYLALVYLLTPLVAQILNSSVQVDAPASLVSLVQAPWLQALASIVSLLDGAILVIIFSSVGSHLFEKTRVETN